jgi:hypothetical protein
MTLPKQAFEFHLGSRGIRIYIGTSHGHRLSRWLARSFCLSLASSYIITIQGLRLAQVKGPRGIDMKSARSRLIVWAETEGD